MTELKTTGEEDAYLGNLFRKSIKQIKKEIIQLQRRITYLEGKEYYESIVKKK